MSAYDDERVIALLHEAVPPLPDAPDRVDAIRHVAGRQRTRIWTQSVGAVAGVLLVVGIAAAVAAPGKSRTLRPVSDPLRVMTDAFLAQKSVRFDVTDHPVGTLPSLAPGDLQKVTGHLTGVATRDGDLQADGTIGFLALAAIDEIAPQHFRVVDGVGYRALGPDDDAPAGKSWIRSDGDSTFDLVKLRQMLRLAEAVAENVRYVGPTTVRGVEAAEYHVTFPEKYTGDVSGDVTFALDADGLPRRIAADVVMDDTEPGLRIHVTVELFGYGDAVSITAPPASQVVTEQELDRGTVQYGSAPNPSRECFQRLTANGGKPTQAEIQACFARSSDGATVFATLAPLAPPSP